VRLFSSAVHTATLSLSPVWYFCSSSSVLFHSDETPLIGQHKTVVKGGKFMPTSWRFQSTRIVELWPINRLAQLGRNTSPVRNQVSRSEIRSSVAWRRGPVQKFCSEFYADFDTPQPTPSTTFIQPDRNHAFVSPNPLLVLTNLLTYLLTYLLSYLLHGSESFLRS
jgi:hypothetical protein